MVEGPSWGFEGFKRRGEGMVMGIAFEHHGVGGTSGHN